MRRRLADSIMLAALAVLVSGLALVVAGFGGEDRWRTGAVLIGGLVLLWAIDRLRPTTGNPSAWPGSHRLGRNGDAAGVPSGAARAPRDESRADRDLADRGR